MESQNPVKLRSEEVRVKMHPDMRKRIDRIASMHGTPTATWCHHVIAQAVVAFERQYQLQNRTQDAVVDAIKDMLGPEVARLFSDAEQRDAIGQATSEAAAPTSAAGEGAKE